jgi:hypothetical protein
MLSTAYNVANVLPPTGASHRRREFVLVCWPALRTGAVTMALLCRLATQSPSKDWHHFTWRRR